MIADRRQGPDVCAILAESGAAHTSRRRVVLSQAIVDIAKPLGIATPDHDVCS